MTSPARIAVIGAGWAGCAAAVTLARKGHPVTLLEASREPGGRARSLTFMPEGTTTPLTLDNGQHILLGAYHQTLRLLDSLGASAHDAFLRLPLQMCYAQHDGGMSMIARRLPAPFHMAAALWKAKGLTWQDKLAMASMINGMRWMQWQLTEDRPVADLLVQFAQTTTNVNLIWQPLCIAALNTPIEQASAQVFMNVLRDSIGARRHASDMLLPRQSLGALLPALAAKEVTRLGGTVQTGMLVRSLTKSDHQWQLEIRGHDTITADAVVVATQAEQAIQLLSPHMDTQALQFAYEPITTCYLGYPAGTRLPRPFMALRDNPSVQAFGQFVFDRGQLSGNAAEDGVLAVVISTSAAALALGHAALHDAVARQIATSLNMPALATPSWHKVVSDKRATFRCTPSLVRPGNDTGVPGLFLAGDYTQSDYPATIETAVESGLRAADALASYWQ